ncbi:hypothetical protein CAPTEDRAFT_194155 [Capitella teleta]|uniref:Ammonium transporter AmtB-like domain-containing protein n=1 Tax=Capitella teleta TaxID=283909 RepID=R7UUB5_CAPTE|nr:hypothetical protein CAPTEDRAFT_194155 [Capitella teleta]|eukprot:ELU06986.1 hypothetical protein CAPTEDRAFT_194155 [Capitella teleta]
MALRCRLSNIPVCGAVRVAQAGEAYSRCGLTYVDFSHVLTSAVSTLFGSMSGGLIALSSSYIFKRRKFEVDFVINGILGGLVAITGHCALAEPWEALIIGGIGAMLTLTTIELLAKARIDDPVGVVGVHAVGGTWSLISVGIFSRDDKLSGALAISHDQVGLIYGGGFKLLGIQMAGIVSIATWSAVTSFLILYAIDRVMTIRVPLQREILGADVVEHSIGDIQFDKMENKIITYRRRGVKGGIVEEVFNRLVDSANEDQHGLERLVFMNSLSNKTHARSLSECFCDHPKPLIGRGQAYLRGSVGAKSNGVGKEKSSSGVEDTEPKTKHTPCGLCGRLAYHRQFEIVYKENGEENHAEQNGGVEGPVGVGGDFVYENDAFNDDVISVSTLSVCEDVTRRNDDVIQTVHL